ncbi:MAG: sensor histidine kinase [Chloroflexota bacterium]
MSRLRQAIVLALSLLSFPVLTALDFLLTPWRIPNAIIYAIPVLVVARFFPTSVATAVLFVAMGFLTLDSVLAQFDVQTVILSLLALGTIGVLGLLWARAEGRARELAEESARLYELEREQSRALEEAREGLLRFFSAVAHDLRSPLTVIRGSAQILSDGQDLRARQQRLIAGISRSAQQLQRLADDLSEASRLGSGRFTLERRLIDLAQVVTDVVDQQRIAAPTHRFTTRIPPTAVEGTWDQDRIAQAVNNLLNNAVKYSPAGTEIITSVRPLDGDAEITVQDQGPGIPLEEQKALFQPYYRLAGAEGIKGLGLGLYIVRSIAEAHGGSVGVASEVGKGSTFTIHLPRDRTPEPP